MCAVLLIIILDNYYPPRRGACRQGQASQVQVEVDPPRLRRSKYDTDLISCICATCEEAWGDDW